MKHVLIATNDYRLIETDKGLQLQTIFWESIWVLSVYSYDLKTLFKKMGDSAYKDLDRYLHYTETQKRDYRIGCQTLTLEQATLLYWILDFYLGGE